MEKPQKIADVLSQRRDRGEQALCSWEHHVLLVTTRDPDHPGMRKMITVYRFDDDENITETIDLNKSVEEIVELLAPKFDAKEFLRQKLNEEGVLEVIELSALLKKHPESAKKVESRKGCLYLNIPNPEPGQEDFKLFLKGN